VSIQRSIFFTFLAQAPTLLLYFVASTLMTNVLGDEGRGAFALLQNLVTYLMMGLGFNFGLGLMYHTARSDGDQRTAVGMASSAFLVNLAVVPSILAALILNDRLRGIFFPGELAHPGYYGYVLCSVLVGQWITFIAAMVQGLKLFHILNRMSIITATFSCGGFGVVWLLRHDIAPGQVLPLALGITLTGVTAQAIIWTVVYVRRIGLPPVPMRDWSVIRPFMAFALTGHLTNIINLINYRFDIWVVNGYTGTANLGLYAVAVGVGQLFFNIPEPLSRVVQPYIYANDSEAMLHRFKIIARLNFTVVALLCAFMALVAPWLLPWLFGHEFAGSVSALRYLLPGIVFCCAYKLLAVVVTQRGLLRYNLYGAILAAITTVVPRFGIIGAAWASTIAYLAILTVTCLVLHYRLRMTVSDLFLLRPADLGGLRSMFLIPPSAP
jgi:O-antigen/teichoic acid export membrane protein